MAIQIYQPVDFPGSSTQTPSFRTWDALDGYLSAQPAGVVAILRGTASIPILVAMSNGSASVIISPIDFTACDVSEFTIGLTGASNIEGRDGVAPTLDSSGLDVSLIEGVCWFNFFLTTGFLASVQALYACSIPTEVNAQVIAIGAEQSYGGLDFDSGGPFWVRRYYQGAPPIFVGSSSSKTVLKPTTGQLVMLLAAQGSTTTDRADLIAGSVSATDPTTSLLQSTRTNVTSNDFGAPRKVAAYCEGKAAAGFSAVIESISAVGGLA